MPPPAGFPPNEQEYAALIARADQKQRTAEAIQEQYTLATNERDALRIEKAQLVADLAAARQRIAELEALTLEGRIAKAEREAGHAEKIAKEKRDEVDRLHKLKAKE